MSFRNLEWPHRILLVVAVLILGVVGTAIVRAVFNAAYDSPEEKQADALIGYLHDRGIDPLIPSAIVAEAQVYCDDLRENGVLAMTGTAITYSKYGAGWTLDQVDILLDAYVTFYCPAMRGR